MPLRVAAVIVVLTALAVAGVAYAVREFRSPRGSAAATFAVPPYSSSAVDRRDVTSQLAGDYAALIPRDDGLATELRRELGWSRDVFSQRLRVTQVDDSAVLSLTVRGQSADEARDAASAVVNYLTSPGADKAIDAATLAPLSRPSSARALPDNTFLVRTSLRVDGGAAAAEPNVDGANRLAANYAGLIPEDSETVRLAARAMGVTPGAVREGLRATSPPNTSIVRVEIDAASTEVARRGVLAIAESVTGPDPTSERIVSGTLVAVRLPEPDVNAATSSPPLTTLLVGGFLGTLLGLLAVAVLRHRNPRVDDTAELAAGLEVPVSDLREWHDELGAALLQRWGIIAGPNGQVVLQSTTPELDGVAAELARRFAGTRTQLDVVTVPEVTVRAHEELEAPLSAFDGHVPLIVVVVRRGQTVRGATAAVDHVRGAGGEVQWAVVAQSVGPARLEERAESPPARAAAVAADGVAHEPSAANR